VKREDLFELAGRNLREAVLRNSLTTLGIGVGVASLVALLSLGAGLQDLVGQRFSRSGLFNTIGVFSPRDWRGGDREARAENPPATELRPLDDSVRRQIAALPNVVEVYPEIRMLTDFGFGEHTFFSSVSALPPSARDSDAFENMQGRYFSGPDAAEAVLQTDFARELLEAQEAPAAAPASGNPVAPAAPPGGTSPPDNKVRVAARTWRTGPLTPDEASKLIGRELLLRYAARQSPGPAQATTKKISGDATRGVSSSERNAETPAASFSVVRRETTLHIVGIIETAPYAGLTNSSNSRVFIPEGLAEKLHPVLTANLRDLMQGTQAPEASYQALVVRVSSPTVVPATQAAIKNFGFRTFSLLDATRNLRRVFAVLDIFLGIFGSVALVVASLGIVNTLVMSVLERRREIGILKALGASDIDVKRLFFAEAGAMGIAGGLFGVALGWLIGRGINFGTGIYLARQDLPRETILVLPWWLAAGAILFAIVVSLVSGLYPAARAAKLNPVEALRYE
jgi:putative ABC transport system permease protein